MKTITSHMKCRMRQRAITPDMVDTILKLGEWSGRGDRIFLSRQAIASEIRQRRDALKLFENIQRRNGLTLVLDGKTQITVYSNSKRMHS